MKATRCPTDNLSLSNCAIINPNEYREEVKYDGFAPEKFQLG